MRPIRLLMDDERPDGKEGCKAQEANTRHGGAPETTWASQAPLLRQPNQPVNDSKKDRNTVQDLQEG